MSRLAEKIAIITGGARGIGAATAECFIEQGAKVVITDVLVEEGEATSAALGESCLFVEHDVSDAAQWQTVVSKAETAFGPVNVLVNNAGIGGVDFCLLEEVDIDKAKRLFDINFFGAVLGMQAVIPAMEKAGGGSIVNISSTTGIRGMNSLAMYGASKAAVMNMSKVAAMELGPRGIRVNTIHPGGADTAMGNMMGVPLEEYSTYQTASPLLRACHPREIANGIIYFASDESAHCTSAELLIDGGQAAGVWFDMLPGGRPKK